MARLDARATTCVSQQSGLDVQITVNGSHSPSDEKEVVASALARLIAATSPHRPGTAPDSPDSGPGSLEPPPISGLSVVPAGERPESASRGGAGGCAR
jgi:hypothetical protein